MSFIPFDLPGFKISRIYSLEDKLVITAYFVQTLAPCPACHTLSSSVHSYYQRSPKDLPSSGKALRLNLTVRRFRCNNPQCSKKVFAERLPGLLAPNAQRTERLNATLQVFADNFSAKIASRVLKKLSMRVSSNTLLRLLKRAAKVVVTPLKPLRIVSIDDFAFKRGRSYGTLVLDLETHRVVELLPDRTAVTLAAWLGVRPQIELVSRDRSPEYARGIREGAPQALQVADRWHLLKNWREVLERLLTRQHSHLQTSLEAKGLKVLHRRKRKRSSTERAAALSARQHRVELYEQVHALKGQNHSILQIAQELGISRSTVRKYLSQEQPCSPSVRRRSTQLIDPYQLYLEKRWVEGCHKAAPLWRELKAQGFSVTYKVVQRWVSLHRDQPGRLLSQREKQRLAATVGLDEPLPAQPLKAGQAQPELVGPGAEPLPSPRQLAWLFIKRASKLSRSEKGWLDFLEAEIALSQVAQLSEKFVGMVRDHRAEGLEDWLEQCTQSPLAELQTFAEGIEQDYKAILAGLTLRWSQGPTEGAVNKLKMIKRTSYGRGSFEQLRARVLRAS